MPQVILPCLDEALALPALLALVPEHWRVIVADNGSSDGSRQIAIDHGAQVVDVPQRGYGAAAHAGLLAATDDVVAFMDADGTLDPRQLDRVAAGVLEDCADLVLGRRRASRPGAFPAHTRFANAVLARRVRRRTGADIHDLGPMRVARRNALLALDLSDRRFGYPLEMITAAADHGWRITEVEVDYHPRATGSKSKVTGTVLGTLRTVRDMSEVLAR